MTDLEAAAELDAAFTGWVEDLDSVPFAYEGMWTDPNVAPVYDAPAVTS